MGREEGSGMNLGREGSTRNPWMVCEHRTRRKDVEHAGGVEQQQGEKPPWDYLFYMMEEESSLHLILQK
jgi:hypothetical protein